MCASVGRFANELSKACAVFLVSLAQARATLPRGRCWARICLVFCAYAPSPEPRMVGLISSETSSQRVNGAGNGTRDRMLKVERLREAIRMWRGERLSQYFCGWLGYMRMQHRPQARLRHLVAGALRVLKKDKAERTPEDNHALIELIREYSFFKVRAGWRLRKIWLSSWE